MFLPIYLPVDPSIIMKGSMLTSLGVLLAGVDILRVFVDAFWESVCPSLLILDVAC